MFIRSNKKKPIEDRISKAFNLYRDRILALHSKQFNQEDLLGESCYQYKVEIYHMAILYCSIIYNNIITIDANISWEDYATAYEVDKYRKEFACHNIDIDEVLAIFDLPFDTNEGIEGIGLEDTFVIEPNFTTPPIYNTTNIQDLLNTSKSCINLIDNDTDFYLDISDTNDDDEIFLQI